VSRKDRQGRHDPATADKVTSIIEAAERAASALIDSADAKAKRYLEEAEAEADRAVAARLEGLVEATDALVDQAEAIRRESERLLETLRRTGARVDSGGNGAGFRADAAAVRGKHLSAVPSDPPRAEPELQVEAEPASEVRAQGEEVRPQRSGNPAGARLLATQMAVSGSSREEIEARLRSGFEIEDTASILDAILGPED
jgi:vacuolar-type H+-ATPase subunit H